MYDSCYKVQVYKHDKNNNNCPGIVIRNDNAAISGLQPFSHMFWPWLRKCCVWHVKVCYTNVRVFGLSRISEKCKTYKFAWTDALGACLIFCLLHKTKSTFPLLMWLQINPNVFFIKHWMCGCYSERVDIWGTQFIVPPVTHFLDFTMHFVKRHTSSCLSFKEYSKKHSEHLYVIKCNL